MRLHMRWIGRHIPRSDAKWVGGLLGQLTTSQIKEAFRCAGYTGEEVAELTNVIEERIAELKDL